MKTIFPLEKPYTLRTCKLFPFHLPQVYNFHPSKYIPGINMGIPYSINSSTISILLTVLLLKKLIFNVNDYLIYAEMHNHILNGVIILNHLKKDIAKKIS